MAFKILNVYLPEDLTRYILEFTGNTYWMQRTHVIYELKWKAKHPDKEFSTIGNAEAVEAMEYLMHSENGTRYKPLSSYWYSRKHSKMISKIKQQHA